MLTPKILQNPKWVFQLSIKCCDFILNLYLACYYFFSIGKIDYKFGSISCMLIKDGMQK
jgi:hypothetical protein